MGGRTKAEWLLRFTVLVWMEGMYQEGLVMQGRSDTPANREKFDRHLVSAHKMIDRMRRPWRVFLR